MRALQYINARLGDEDNIKENSVPLHCNKIRANEISVSLVQTAHEISCFCCDVAACAFDKMTNTKPENSIYTAILIDDRKNSRYGTKD